MADDLEHWIQQLTNVTDNNDKMTEKQINILKAAVEVFAEKGYAASSTSEIAQKAGVAEGTIFRHYKTKKDLLLSIVLPTVAKLIAPLVLRDFQKVLDSHYARYEDFLRAVFVNRLEFARKNMKILKILLQEVPFHPELKEMFKEAVGYKVLESLSRVVTHFQEKGQIIALPSRTVVRLSVSAILGFLLTRFIVAPESEWDEPQEIDMTIDFIMHGLSASLRPDSPAAE